MSFKFMLMMEVSSKPVSPLSTSPTIVDSFLRGSGLGSHATLYISLGAEEVEGFYSERWSVPIYVQIYVTATTCIGLILP